MAHSFLFTYLSLAIIGGVTAILSIVGDLSFSIIKRSYDVKDFGNLIPGHGGMMDRFDSVVIVGPFISVYPTITSDFINLFE